MQIEQEIASIASFVLTAAGNPNPYYSSVPEQFSTPAVYFPSPEVVAGGETFRTYRLQFAWYISFHDSTSEGAYDMAQAALNGILRSRSLIPLLLEDGTPAGEYLRIDTASVKPVDAGVYQLSLDFVSRRPYNSTEAMKSAHLFADIVPKSVEGDAVESGA